MFYVGDYQPLMNCVKLLACTIYNKLCMQHLYYIIKMTSNMKSVLQHIIFIFLLSAILVNVVSCKKTKLCICMEEIASNLRDPLIIRNAADRTGRLFIGEQKGIIHTLIKNGKMHPKPFLNISDKVFEFTSPDGKGLLNLAFHPNFKTNRRFFIYYAIKKEPNNPEDDHVALLSEFCVSKRDLHVADPSSEKVIMEIQQPFQKHNGGEILFDNDGYLFLTLGDGGGIGDPRGNAQNTSTLFGKLLRINIDRKDKNKRYAIPPDNPFVNDPTFRPEIYAYGLRNTWRCGKDRGDRVTGKGKGRIMCGDVGEDTYEEVDLIQRGGNYGWNSREGFKCFNDLCGRIGPEVFPVFAYSHSGERKSVIGGEFYRGKLNPGMNGLYIFGDFLTGQLFRLLEKAPNKWEGAELKTCSKKECDKQSLTNTYGRYIRSFGMDEPGEIYMVSVADLADPTSGKLYKIRQGLN